MGGSVRGGEMLGQYPDDITTGGPLNIGRGRILPTLGWESMLNGVAQWLGVVDEVDLNYIMPNKVRSGSPVYTCSEVFEGCPASAASTFTRKLSLSISISGVVLSTILMGVYTLRG